MTLGSNNKAQVYILIGLGVVAAYFVYTNLLAGPPSVPAANMDRPASGAADTASALSAARPAALSAARASSRNHADEFHPVYIPKRAEDRPDPTRIDPTLRLDLFAKVQGVEPAGGSRNLFQFAIGPPPGPAVKQLAGAEPLVNVHVFQGPRQPAPPAPKPGPPPPPPITLKFYGFSTASGSGKKLGYFLDGEDILLAGEGDTMKKRYRVVRIGPNSAVLEDLDARREQSVPLAAEGGA